MKSKIFKINDPSLRRGRRTNDTIVSAVTHNILFFIQFVNHILHTEEIKWNAS